MGSQLNVVMFPKLNCFQNIEKCGHHLMLLLLEQFLYFLNRPIIVKVNTKY